RGANLAMTVDPERPAPDELLNPYAAPEAEIGAEPLGPGLGDAEAEAIREAHIIHESSVRSVGVLNYLGAGVMALAAVGIAAAARAPNARIDPSVLTILAAVYGCLAVLFIALGIGIRRLQPWARWTEVLLILLGTLGTLSNAAVTANFNPALAGPAGCGAIA